MVALARYLFLPMSLPVPECVVRGYGSPEGAGHLAGGRGGLRPVRTIRGVAGDRLGCCARVTYREWLRRYVDVEADESGQ